MVRNVQLWFSIDWKMKGLQLLADACAAVSIHAFRATASRAMGAPVGLTRQAN